MSKTVSNFKRIVGKVFVKEVKHEGSKFNVYTLLSAGGNWYGIKGDANVSLKNSDKEVVAIEVSKMFEKEFTSKNGEVGVERNLIMEAKVQVTDEEVQAFIEAEQKANAQTLANVN